jgi:uncharacterized protein
MSETIIFDKLPLTGLHRDSAGNVIGVARAARTGIQVYAGYEVGKPELRQVRLYRPESEVFSRDSMRTFAGVPVCIDHPAEAVTPDNWKDHAVGETESDGIVRDGEVVKVPFIVRDAQAIKDIEDGKHEVSMGYSSMLEFIAGQTPTGEAYDAIQRTIRINHLAIVDKARGGPTLRIADTKQEKTVETKTVLVDGLSVETTPAGETAIVKLIRERDEARAKISDAEAKTGTLTADIATRDGEIVALKAQVADATSPAKLAAAASARSSLCDAAKRILPAIVTDGKDDAAIRREVVNAKLGDAGKALSDGPAVEGAFSALAAAAPQQSQRNPLDRVVTNDSDPTSFDDAMTARNKAREDRRYRYQNFGKEPAKA